MRVASVQTPGNGTPDKIYPFYTYETYDCREEGQKPPVCCGCGERIEGFGPFGNGLRFWALIVWRSGTEIEVYGNCCDRNDDGVRYSSDMLRYRDQIHGNPKPVIFHEDMESSLKHRAVFDAFARGSDAYWLATPGLSVDDIRKFIKPRFGGHSGHASKGLWWDLGRVLTYSDGSYNTQDKTVSRLTATECAELLHEIIHYSPVPKPAVMQVPVPGTQLTLF